jgi:hypothetical protein
MAVKISKKVGCFGKHTLHDGMVLDSLSDRCSAMCPVKIQVKIYQNLSQFQVQVTTSIITWTLAVKDLDMT